jgi:hypothetical protein
MRAASESRGGEEGTAEVEVEEEGETEGPAVAAQHRRAENRGRIEEYRSTVNLSSTCSGNWLKYHKA